MVIIPGGVKGAGHTVTVGKSMSETCNKGNGYVVH